MAPDAGTQKVNFPCQGCGANLEYSAEVSKLECPYCGRTQALDTEQDQAIVEYDFDDAVQNAKRTRFSQVKTQGVEVHCKNCGSRAVVDDQAAKCAFCDSPVVVELDAGETIVPESVLPFAVEKSTAKAAFVRWLKTRWFAPNDLKRKARNEGLDGVYLPYWTYDSNTHTRYSGRRGIYYYVSESYTDSAGNRKTRQVRKTRWYPASGTVDVGFDDVLIPATASLPDKLLHELEPWDLESLKPYASGFLSGFSAERYALDFRDGFPKAEARMEPTIRSAVRRDIGGDTQMILSLVIRHNNVRFKHLLLPLWISSYRYKDKVFRFIVNARTGEATGERPYSVIKITLFVMLVLGVVLGIWMFSEGRI